MKTTYADVADELVLRILTLAETKPEVSEMKSPWDLFSVGLKCDDLAPSLFQASWALKKAQQEIQQRRTL